MDIATRVASTGRYEAIIRSIAGALRDRTVEIGPSGLRVEPGVPFAPGARLSVEPIRRLFG